MKSFAVLIATVWLASFASAQVKINIVLESEQYVANEPLIARVRIVNDSGTTLHLGEEPDWLTFAIETQQGPYVRNLKPPQVAGAFDLESSKTATKRVDLAPCFNLTESGRYKVVATVKVPAFNTTFASPGKTFDIVSGSRLWEKQFGVPASIAAPDANGLPEVRKYMLIQALAGKVTKLFVRVTDQRENNIRVVPIGSLISFSKPEAQLDKWSNLHVMYQSGSKSFSYSMINPEGLLIARETHEYTETRPTMTSNDEGHIVIRGGSRRPAIDDIPPFDAAELPEEVREPAPELAATNSASSKKTPTKKPASSINAKEKKKP